MTAEHWMRIAGVTTWLVSAVPALLRVSSGRLPDAAALVWLVAFVAFGAAFWIHARPCTSRARGLAVALLGVQSAAGLTMVVITGDTLPAATLVIVAAQLPYVLALQGAVLWLAVQTLLLGMLVWSTSGPVTALAAGGAFAGFQMFAVTTAWLARSERLAREALGRAHAELTATRELLAESSRMAERLRIARDLHDTLGHHLTALSIQLEVASRLAAGPATRHIREAHAVARLLLADVRSVVSTLRGSSRIDLSQSLRALAVAPGPLKIHFEMPERLDLDDGAQAHALLRCVQEIITNSARHASAGNLWIAIVQRPDGIDLHARDDGRGAAAVRWGNGLRGMRERFEEYAGRVEVRSAAGQGFEVRGFMPRAEAA
ncbi:MAG: sensor histidine kinase [Vicinamibacterales bacterium]